MESKNNIVVHFSDCFPHIYTEIKVPPSTIDKYGVDTCLDIELGIRDVIQNAIKKYHEDLKGAEKIRYLMGLIGKKLKDIDFSNHEDVNAFFYHFPAFNTHERYFVDLIVGMEQAAKKWHSFGNVTVSEVMDSLELIDQFTDEEAEKMSKFEWNQKHPFDYQINVTRPDKDGKIKYYVVFSSAPVKRN